MSFVYAFIYLSAAVMMVPLAKRLVFGSFVGYLFSCVVIGPFCLGLVGSGSTDVMRLERRPALLSQMQRAHSRPRQRAGHRHDGAHHHGG